MRSIARWSPLMVALVFAGCDAAPTEPTLAPPIGADHLCEVYTGPECDHEGGGGGGGGQVEPIAIVNLTSETIGWFNKKWRLSWQVANGPAIQIQYGIGSITCSETDQNGCINETVTGSSFVRDIPMDCSTAFGGTVQLFVRVSGTQAGSAGNDFKGVLGDGCPTDPDPWS